MTQGIGDAGRRGHREADLAAAGAAAAVADRPGRGARSYLGKPWSRQAVHQAERGQRSFTAAELTALALALDTSVPALFRAETAQIELPGLAVSPEQYRGILLNRERTHPWTGSRR